MAQSGHDAAYGTVAGSGRRCRASRSSRVSRVVFHRHDAGEQARRSESRCLMAAPSDSGESVSNFHTRQTDRQTSDTISACGVPDTDNSQGDGHRCVSPGKLVLGFAAFIAIVCCVVSLVIVPRSGSPNASDGAVHRSDSYAPNTSGSTTTTNLTDVFSRLSPESSDGLGDPDNPGAPGVIGGTVNNTTFPSPTVFSPAPRRRRRSMVTPVRRRQKKYQRCDDRCTPPRRLSSRYAKQVAMSNESTKPPPALQRPFCSFGSDHQLDSDGSYNDEVRNLRFAFDSAHGDPLPDGRSNSKYLSKPKSLRGF